MEGFGRVEADDHKWFQYPGGPGCHIFKYFLGSGSGESGLGTNHFALSLAPIPKLIATNPH